MKLKTKYCKLIYSSDKHLEKFWKKSRISGPDMLDSVVGVACRFIGYPIRKHHKYRRFNIEILPNKGAVRQKYKELHELDTGCIAFVDLYIEPATIYVSIKNLSKKILSHEIGHVMLDKYVGRNLSVELHELIAVATSRVVLRET